MESCRVKVVSCFDLTPPMANARLRPSPPFLAAAFFTFLTEIFVMKYPIF